MPTTPNYGWNVPTVDADFDTWGYENNAAWMLCDAEMFKKSDKTTAQTPWTQNIEGAGFALQHTGGVSVGALATASAANPVVVVQGAAGSAFYANQPLATDECRLLLSNDAPNYGYISVHGSAHASVPRRNQCVIYATQGIVLAPANVDAMRLLPSGRVLVGAATDDGASLAQFAGNVRISSLVNDNAISLQITKPNGGQAVVALTANDTYSAHVQLTSGTQIWRAGVGLASTVIPSFDVYDQTGNYFPIRCMPPSTGKQVLVEARLSVSVPSTAPSFGVHVLGPGTSQTGQFTPSLNRENTVCIIDSTFGGQNGGALLLGTGALTHCAIRGCLTDGTSFGLGKLSFLVRTASGTEVMTEAVAINSVGIAVPLMPSTNPGGGSKTLWYDPADGNRVKFAA